MPSPIYPEVISLQIILAREVKGYPWTFQCESIVLLTLRFLTPLSLIYSYRPLFPFVAVKVSFHPNFSLKFLKFLSHSGNVLNTCSDMSQRPSSQSSLVSSVVSCTFREISHQNLLSILHDILFLTESSVVAAGMVIFYTKSLVPKSDFLSLLHRTMCNHLLVLCHSSSIWTPVSPINLRYTTQILWQLPPVSEL